MSDQIKKSRELAARLAEWLTDKELDEFVAFLDNGGLDVFADQLEAINESRNPDSYREAGQLGTCLLELTHARIE